MEYAITQDVKQIAEMPTAEINTVIAGMTALMQQNKGIEKALASQNWYQRMIRTVIGKNKIAVSEIKANHEKLNAYMSEAIVELYKRNCIDEKIMLSLSSQINTVYAEQNELKESIIKLAEKLNEKIKNVDNFHMIITEIEQGVYSHYSGIVSIILILSQLDNRTLNDKRKMEILQRSLEAKGIVDTNKKLISLYLLDLLDTSKEELTYIYLELGWIEDNYFAKVVTQMMCEYYFLSDVARRMKDKNVIIQNIMISEGLDVTASISLLDLFSDICESKKATANDKNFGAKQIHGYSTEDENNVGSNDDQKENTSNTDPLIEAFDDVKDKINDALLALGKNLLIAECINCAPYSENKIQIVQDKNLNNYIKEIGVMNPVLNELLFNTANELLVGFFFNMSSEFVIIYSAGLLIKQGIELVHIAYENLYEVKEDESGIQIDLHEEYDICELHMKKANNDFYIIKRTPSNTVYLRAFRKYLQRYSSLGEDFYSVDSFDIDNILEEYLPKIVKSCKYYDSTDFELDEKVSKKLSKALSTYARCVRREEVRAFTDSSLFGTGSDGILFSDDGIAFDYAFSKVFLHYSEIKKIDFSKNGKELIFRGEFSENPNVINPTISNIYYNLDELKECIEKICYLV